MTNAKVYYILVSKGDDIMKKVAYTCNAGIDLFNKGATFFFSMTPIGDMEYTIPVIVREEDILETEDAYEFTLDENSIVEYAGITKTLTTWGD